MDGKVPNEAFRSYGMAYSTKYKTSTLEDSEGNKLSINLEKGSHGIILQHLYQVMTVLRYAVQKPWQGLRMQKKRLYGENMKVAL